MGDKKAAEAQQPLGAQASPEGMAEAIAMLMPDGSSGPKMTSVYARVK